MVPATRQMTSAAVYAHLLDNVLLLPQGHPIRLSFEQQGYESADDLLCIFENELESLGYTPSVLPDGLENPPTIPLLMAHRQIIRHFLRWQASLERQKGTPLKNSELVALNNEDFVLYRRSALGQVSTATAPVNAPPTVQSPIGKTRSAVEDFKRGIKRDKTHYPVLKDDRYWDNFYRSFVVTAVTHNVDKVLDPTYIPTDPLEKSLFEEQNKFVYSALEHTLQTDMGKNIVREHSFDFNAQEVFRKVVKHYTESASAKISSSTTLGYLTTAKYGSSWTGTAEGFILHWKNHLRIYNDTVPAGEQLPQQLCLSLLENAVHDVPELRQVKITATLDLAKGGNPISYGGYLSLLLASASLYDNGNNLSNSRSGKNKRNIYANELEYNPMDFESKPDVDYDIDVSPTAIYEANAHARKSSSRNRSPATNRERPYIPREMWNLLSDDAKAILQGLIAPGKQAPLNNSSPHQSLQANTHDTIGAEQITTDTFHDCAPETELLAHLTERVSHMSDGDIRKVLAASRNGPAYDEPTPLQSNVLQYQVSRHNVIETTAALVDRGANGGLAGSDVMVLHKTGRSATITGINDHTLSDLDIVTAAGYTESQNGPIILIMNQYAHLGQGKTIHSSAQLEHYRNHVEDRSRTVGGNQRIVTLDDYIIPLHIRQGLAYMDMRRPTDKELATLPHVVLTSDVDWDPSVLDHEIDLATSWYDDIYDLPQSPYVEPRFDHTGKYLHRHISLCNHRDDVVDRVLYCQQHLVTKNVQDYEALRPCFGWVSAETVRKTIMATTQHAREVYNAPLRKHFKSRFPALNVHRRNEPVATDTIWSDTPAVDNGAKFAQLFVGRRSLVTDAYPMKTDKEFVNTLEDHIRYRGAMDKLISDRAQVEISKKVTDITRAYNIDQWQSEPNHQHQNFAERRIATIEANTNNILNLSGAPDSAWLLCVTYVCYVFNHLAHESLDNRTPLEVLTGSTPDISVLLQFHFWEPVYYKLENATFPSGGTEQQGRFVGIADSVGDALTYKILTHTTNRILHRSSVRSATIPGQTNLRLTPQDGESGPKPINFIKSRRTENKNSYAIKELPGFTPDDLIGRTNHAENIGPRQALGCKVPCRNQ
ncbi:predicted protein [Phaeodactylum tricornutum CCAP 1055/1]|uniref:Integrase catalytic domain-containing protein n=1 Tax=Phaeodactylum tricornutum (strain CCAP 1055/1) TaxID=556484 RepID=B7GEE6_PHATC|nr:predicted protein [Phaeodactylum tricornutum CCAP 1055/1]EEC42961.1 predicted protein [Phaeodactylum tricornutum CCAP 1055/1]|eukprot:XP_002185474.1 predicted protein [Phaeodactylum tricornutum CCAP 1055/1]